MRNFNRPRQRVLLLADEARGEQCSPTIEESGYNPAVALLEVARLPEAHCDGIFRIVKGERRDEASRRRRSAWRMLSASYIAASKSRGEH